MLHDEVNAIADRSASSLAATEEAGLRFVSDEEKGLLRRRWGKAFRYINGGGQAVRDKTVLARIRKLAIPPAWTDVWICARADGHIQATGRDAKARKQYRYHADWQKVRDEAKYDRLLDFGQQLPAVRETIRAHMGERGLGRRKVLATVVHLLDTTLIRIGNMEYARANKSFGLTTLRDRHVSFSGSEIRFHFRGKTGKEWRLSVTNRRVAKIVKSCQDLPGQHLFQYSDDKGEIGQVTSADVNGYLREIAGRDVTAKDFRTWAGTVLAAMALAGFEPATSPTALKRNIRLAIGEVAARLGNTVAICRKCYIHPEVLDCYAEGALGVLLDGMAERAASSSNLSPEEEATLRLLQRRSVQPS